MRDYGEKQTNVCRLDEKGEKMNKNLIIISIAVAIFILLAGLDSVVAKEGLTELSSLDSFHPPTTGDPRILMYKEWHYFNILDEEQNLSFITTLTLNGNLSNPTMSSAIVLMSYITPVKDNITIDVYPVTRAQWSNKTPDMRIARSSVTLTEQGYNVHLESNDTGTVFDALFKSEAELAPVFNVPAESGRIVSWLVASPKMNVNGKLTI